MASTTYQLQGKTYCLRCLIQLFCERSLVVKAGWSLLVLLSISSAGYLIHNSFANWSKSPIATTVSTHPIEELPFPTVTLCPPKGANTALNYDIMQAEEGSLTLRDREEIKLFAKSLFEDKEASAFTDELVELINLRNLKALYNSEEIETGSFYPQTYKY